jgi:hypothetical protein
MQNIQLLQYYSQGKVVKNIQNSAKIPLKSAKPSNRSRSPGDDKFTISLNSTIHIALL